MRYKNKGIVKEQLRSFYFTSRAFSKRMKKRRYQICGHKQVYNVLFLYSYHYFFSNFDKKN